VATEAVGNLAVTITAVDRATATIEKVRDRVGAVTEPTRQLQAAFSRLGDATGINRLSAAMGAATGHATSLARTVATAALPLASGGIIASTGAMAANFVRTGKTLLEGARSLSMSVSDLDAFRQAARMAGVGAEDAQAGLEAFESTINDAFFGRNSVAAAAAQMKRLGFDLRDSVTGGARSGADALGDLAEAYAKLNHDPNAQAEFARIWNVQPLDKFLRRGREGVAELTRQARARGVMSEEEAKQAKRLGEQWDRMLFSGERLTTMVGGALAPSMEHALVRMNRWVLANEKWLATNISTRIEEVGRGTGTFVGAVDKAVTSTIGWERATIALEALLAAKLLKTLTGVNAAALALSVLRLPPWALALLGAGGLVAGNSLIDRRALQDAARQGAADREAGRTGWTIGGRPAGEAWDGFRRMFGFGMETAPGPAGFPNGARMRGAQDLGGAARIPGQLEPDIERRVRERASAHGVDPDFAVRIARIEGGGRNRVSPAGAMGPMQLMPGTARQLGVNPMDVDQNIDGGVRYLRQLLNRFGGDQRAAAAGYNAGPNRGSVHSFATTGNAAGLPRETQEYIRSLDALSRAAPAQGPVPGPRLAPSAPSPLDGGRPQAMNGRVDVNVRLAGAQQGTVATASGEGIAHVAPPLVETAMTGWGGR
jgi:hypothetical protein